MIVDQIFKLDMFLFIFYFCRINIDFSLISWGFGKFPQVLTMWFYMQAATLALYPAFILWIQYRHINPGGSFGFMVSISHLSTVLHLVSCTWYCFAKNQNIEIYVKLYVKLIANNNAGLSVLKSKSTDRKDFFALSLYCAVFSSFHNVQYTKKPLFLFCLGLIDKGFLMGYLLYLASFLCLPVWGLLEDDIPPISSVVVTMEQVSVRNLGFNYSIQEQRTKVSDWGFWPYRDCHCHWPNFYK